MELLYGNSIKSYPKGFNGEKWNTQRQNIKRKKDKPFSYLKGIYTTNIVLLFIFFNDFIPNIFNLFIK